MNDDRERDNDVEHTRRRPTSGAGSIPPARDATIPDPFAPDGHISAELLSAWLDDPAEGNGTPEQRQAIEVHLAGCPTCQATLAELRTIVLALAALPQVATPRSFALTPEMVAVPKPVNLRKVPGKPVDLRNSRPWYERQLAALRWATAVAAILFVFVVSADIVSRGPVSTSDDAANLTTSMKAESTVTSGGAMAEDAETLMADDDQADAVGESSGDSGGESTPASASGAAEAQEEQEQEAPAPESDVAPAAGATEASDEVVPAPGDAEPTAAGDTMAAYSATEPATDNAARDGDGSDEATDDTTGLTMQTPVDDGTGQSDSFITDTEDADSTWRLLQVGLALLIVWLLAAMIALPRLRTRSGATDDPTE